MSTIEVDGEPLQVSNLDKVFYRDDGITKGDVIEYYRLGSVGDARARLDRPR